MEVGHDQLGLAQFLQQIAGYDIALPVVVVRVGGQQHTQPVTDGDARRHDQKGVGEARVFGVGEFVQRLPGNEHGHDHGLAGAGRHLEGNAEETGVGALVGHAQRVVDPRVVLARCLRQVDGRLQRLELAEEETLYSRRCASAPRVRGCR